MAVPIASGRAGNRHWFFGHFARETRAIEFPVRPRPGNWAKSPLAPAPSCGGELLPKQAPPQPFQRARIYFIAGFIVAVIEAKSLFVNVAKHVEWLNADVDSIRGAYHFTTVLASNWWASGWRPWPRAAFCRWVCRSALKTGVLPSGSAAKSVDLAAIAFRWSAFRRCFKLPHLFSLFG